MKHINTHTSWGKPHKQLAAMAFALTMGAASAQAQQDTARTAQPADSTLSRGAEPKRNITDEARQLITQCFTTLKNNRATYNQYNDSIFTISDHDKWVAFFKRRAEKNHQIYEEDKQAINQIREYLTPTRGYKPKEVYSMLSNEMGAYIGSSDPFIAMHLLEYLEDFYANGECPDSINCLLPVYNTAVYFCKQISNMGNDNDHLVKAYKYNKAILDFDATRGNYAYGNYCKIHALRTMSTLSLIGENAETIEEAKDYNEELLKLLKDNDVTYNNAFNSEADVKEVRHIAESFNERLVRNYYLNDTTVLDKATADSIMRATVSRYKQQPKSDYRTQLRCLLFEVQLGDITMTEARREALKLYESARRSMVACNTLTPEQICSFIMPYLTFFYINDMANVPHSAKRSAVMMMCEDIITAYHKITHQQKDTGYVKYLNMIATYDRVNKYLKPKERVMYLNELIVSTQVTTYAHSVHVGIIAKMLMQSILEHEPELLTGMLGCRDAHEVEKKKDDFMTFIHEAALYHDLGKNQMIPIVTNDYRPLYDEEFAIIKRHPELGLKYLELSPTLARYHDTTLGHHKWYNGKGGYPDSFDNTKSPYRTLIDIITLSDCMQAATEQVGRNYKGEKTFDTVMEEFRQQAGTRFNPDLVRFIDEHADLADQLRDNLNTSWYNIYYDIYSKYIKK